MFLGVLPEYRLLGIDAYFYLQIIEKGKELGYEEADCSLIVETNKNRRE